MQSSGNCTPYGQAAHCLAHTFDSCRQTSTAVIKHLLCCRLLLLRSLCHATQTQLLARSTTPYTAAALVSVASVALPLLNSPRWRGRRWCRHPRRRWHPEGRTWPRRARR
ncbi:unnamed protein product, partial [Ectocarpus sp. 8 AP-2014]